MKQIGFAKGSRIQYHSTCCFVYHFCLTCDLSYLYSLVPSFWQWERGVLVVVGCHSRTRLTVNDVISVVLRHSVFSGVAMHSTRGMIPGTGTQHVVRKWSSRWCVCICCCGNCLWPSSHRTRSTSVLNYKKHDKPMESC